MIELVHAKLALKYAAAWRLSGMPVGCAMLIFSVFQICLCLLERGWGIEFPQKHAILADCTVVIIYIYKYIHVHINITYIYIYIYICKYSIPTHLVTAGPVPHASAPGLSGLPTCHSPDHNDAAPVDIANDRPLPLHQDIRDLDEAIPRQRLSSAHSPLPPSTSCGQASPEPLARPLVAPSELT